MLNEYLKDSAAFGLPRNVIVVWTDDNDGAMRFLPADKGQWKHGVYYHLAYLGQVAKQNAHIVTPARIATEFRKIIDAGATEYMLVNVSELREFVMEARMIGEIAWDGNVALKETAKQPRPSEVKPFVPSTREAREAASQPASEPSGDRYVRWWCEEYFGNTGSAGASPSPLECYQNYYRMLNSYDKLWYGSERVQFYIHQLENRFAGTGVDLSEINHAELLLRLMQYRQVFNDVEKVRAKMNRQQRQFFFDHVELPMLMDYRPTQAAMILSEALEKDSDENAWKACEAAMKPLEELEVEILRAEHPPFEG
jgi:hypothetical protein